MSSRVGKVTRKWDYHVIPRRFKVLWPTRGTYLKGSLVLYDELETEVFVVLHDLGVPPEEWPYYVAFSKEALERLLLFWYDTAQIEMDALQYEWINRGLDPVVLAALKGVVRSIARRERGIFDTIHYSGFETCDWSEWDARAGTHFYCQMENQYAGLYAARKYFAPGPATWYAGDCWRNLAPLSPGDRVNLEGYVYYDRLIPSTGFWIRGVQLALTTRIINPGGNFLGGIVAGFGVYCVPRGTPYLYLIRKRDTGDASGWSHQSTGLAVQEDTWYKILLEVYRHPTGGWARLYIDDDLKVDWIGINTKERPEFACMAGHVIEAGCSDAYIDVAVDEITVMTQ